MSPLFTRYFIFALAASALLLGCSSGGESGTGATASNQTTQGVITGFGSIFVNGVEYNTDMASVFVDGTQLSETDLAVGMVVTINGSVDSSGVTGTANTVTSKTEVEGLVLQNNISGNGTIDVMGQTVHISNDTRFKPGTSGLTSMDMLVAGTHVVEVSGYSNSRGDIYATYVKVVDSSGTVSEVKLHGAVSLYDSASGSFYIGNINVNYDSSTRFEGGVTAADLLDGLTVSVESSNYVGSGPVLAATIEQENLNNDSEGTEMELEGVVTDDSLVVSDSQFELNGRVIHINAKTAIDGGIQADIQNEMTLEVEGKAQADGSVLAYEISFREESSMEVTGPVMNVGNNTLTVDSTFIVVNELTQFEDETNENNQYFHFNDIMTSMNVTVKYYFDPEVGNVATSVEKVM